MHVNPFVYDRPLPPSELVARGEVLEQLLTLAAGGQSARLAAPRRYGKTTLLGALADVASGAHEMTSVFVDFSRVTSVEDVVVRIVRAYDRSLARGPRGLWRAIRSRLSTQAQLGVPGAQVTANIAARPPAVGLAALHEVLELPALVFERTGSRTLVIFDEFQDLLTAGEGLDGLLRSHIQHHTACASYLFAGSQTSLMQALFGDRERPLFEQARSVRLAPLPLPELEEHVADLLIRAGRADLEEHAAGITSLSQGHPQRAMLLAHMLFEQRLGAVAPIEDAIEASVREAGDALEQTWRGLTGGQRRVLGAVAAGHRQLTGGAALSYTGNGKGTQASIRDTLIASAHLYLPDGEPEFVDPLMPLWIRGR